LTALTRDQLRHVRDRCDTLLGEERETRPHAA
jgi:hypothetical protein